MSALPLIVQAPAGHMMCVATIGMLVRVHRVTALRCGSAQGCGGKRLCTAQATSMEANASVG